ncbi:MAG: phosphoglycerate dehydrogenase [Chloroherpetonaceae bacterium]|nr:phosphoglycerate dehydrogenase [Chloroherpetonaceae bacterium]MCS7210864.1 phosphoglycerate dehydrogenase [Chloroherpetonaceae bacterium]MDW8020831.1 phosphoglycerate dehydrogenase [Chloroherpetonaceae bacterium]MDW8466784.1 phosphoglycerate dehydrogenase [Chloroherpetonaceae bacterium]
MRTLILDNIEKTCGERLRQNGFEVVEKQKLSKDELKAEIKNYEVVLVRSATKLTADILACADSLKLIGRAGAGVDNIDIDAATRKGVIVMNTPGGNTISAAEHTCAMLLAVARLLPQAHAELKQGIWDKKKWMGRELEGKTLGILGLGKIGREVAKRMQAFGMRIVAFDPMVAEEFAAKLGITLLPMEELFRESDFITIHTPYSEATRNLLSAKAFGLMKTGVRIVNCARGGIVNEHDLVEAVQSGKVAAAALDVFETEPIPPDHPLLRLENVIVTPHIAASTVEAQEKVALQIAEQVIRWKETGELIGAVNATTVELAQKTEVKAYLVLAEKLGAMVAQLLDGTPKSMAITVYGDFLCKFSEAISAAALKGVLDEIQHREINYINVFAMAHDLNLQVHQHREKEHTDYQNLVVVEYETTEGKKRLGGIALGAKDLRVVMYDHFICEFKPEGYILIYINDDKPGVMARVGARLLRASINIANISLSRNEEKTKALTVICLDEGLSQATLKRIAEVEGVYSPRLIKV